MIGVIGAGLVGTHVVDTLIARGQAQLVVNDANVAAARRLSLRSSSGATKVRAVATSEMFSSNVVVLACPAPHAKAARKLLEAGVSVVSCSDDLDDTLAMLDLDAIATQSRQTLVIGATMSPGLSGVLVRTMSSRFSSVDEAHVAIHGTAGPACAQQHHRALAGQSIGWHDGDWLRRPAGSGRELCWFPDPVGPRDCYRAELADPVAIHQALPELLRVSVRMSANRRDRLTARLPMLTPPHAEGGIGALRVEVRGWRDQARHVEVVGIADRVAHVAGLVAATAARKVISGEFASGARLLGDQDSPNVALLNDLVEDGLRIQEFVGSALG
ncbi:MAG: hypothetical protein RL072_1525 [Actinomycetota bacterium]